MASISKIKVGPALRTAVLSAMLGVTTLSGCTGTRGDGHEDLQQGETALRNGDFGRARIFAKNALQANSRLTGAYLLLAEVDEQGKKWNSMLGNLREALRLEPDNVRAHLKLGQLYLLDRQFDKALDEAASVLKVDPDSNEAAVLRGAVYLHRSNPADAVIEAEKVLAKDPVNMEASALKSRVLAGERRYGDAIKVLDQAIAARPQDVTMRLLRIAYKEESKDFDGAVHDFRELLDSHPGRSDIRFSFGDLLVRIGRQQDAEETLRQGLREQPTHLSMKLKLLSLLSRRDLQVAEQSALTFSTAEPQQLALKLALVDIYTAQKRFADAKELLSDVLRVEKNAKHQVTAKAKMAAVATAENDLPTAERWLNEVLAIDAANRDALLQRAALRLARHEPEAAVADLRIVLRDYPELDSALTLLAQAHLQMGAPELAETHFRQALEMNPTNPAAAYPVAAGMVQRRDLDRAEEVLNRVLQANPGAQSALELIAQLRVLRDDLAGADKAAAQLAQNKETTAAASFISGLIFARQGRHEEAIAKYQAALNQKPTLTEALYGLARSYNALDKREPLLKYLEAFVDNYPQAPEARTTLGLAYGVEKRWGDAVRTLKVALEQDPKSTTTYQILSNVYIQQGQIKEAGAVYQAGLQKLPDNPRLLEGLAEFYEHEQNFAEAASAYERILKNYPNNDRAANNLAAILADHQADMDSLGRAQALVERFGNSQEPHQLDTLGWVTLKSGEVDKALVALEKAVHAAPQTALYRYHLGQAYAEASQVDKAQKELKTAIDLAHSHGPFAGVEQATELLKRLAVEQKAMNKS